MEVALMAERSVFLDATKLPGESFGPSIIVTLRELDTLVF